MTPPRGYSCSVLADSTTPSGVRLTTILVRFPRIVLAEFNTHRMLSRNSASSRAIPVEKRIQAVMEDPFIPAAFCSNQRGMQAGGVLGTDEHALAWRTWMAAAADACEKARQLAAAGVHKQWANRLIEPFAWTEVIASATEWSNFFHLRISPMAQPEIRAAAEAMKAAMDASTPKALLPGQWHLPLVSNEDRLEAMELDPPGPETPEGWMRLAKLSTARCARVSYLTHEGKRDPSVDIALHDKLLADGHLSPFEHPAMVGGSADPRPQVYDGEFIGNFRAPWVQYRKTIPREADRLGESA